MSWTATVGIGVADGAAQRRRQRRRIAARADRDRQRRLPCLLPVVREERRKDRIAGAFGMHVGHHADDRDGRAGATGPMWIRLPIAPFGKVLAQCCLVDHRDVRRRAVVVAGGEEATCEQWHAQGPEVVAAHRDVCHVREIRFVVDLSFDAHRRPARSLGGKRVRRTHRDDARRPREFTERLIVEVDSPRRRVSYRIPPALTRAVRT